MDEVKVYWKQYRHRLASLEFWSQWNLKLRIWHTCAQFFLVEYMTEKSLLPGFNMSASSSLLSSAMHPISNDIVSPFDLALTDTFPKLHVISVRQNLAQRSFLRYCIVYCAMHEKLFNLPSSRNHEFHASFPLQGVTITGLNSDATFGIKEMEVSREVLLQSLHGCVIPSVGSTSASSRSMCLD